MEANWKFLQLKMLEYTMFKTGRLRWRTPSGSLPRGLSPEDLVVGAIQKTFEGARAGASGPGIRRWNPATCPDLLDFLKSVIDSDVGHLVTSEEHRMTQYSETGEQAELPDHGRNPEEHLIHREDEREAARLEGYLDSLQEEFKDDREVCLVLQSYLEQARRGASVKPATVVKETGLPIEVVRNAIKRMKRRVLSSGTPPERAAPPARTPARERNLTQ
jgi:hypothetical protein